jgi:hypothetical protein
VANSRYNPDQIALGRKERFFVTKETTYGTIAEPANSDLVRLVGTASFKQAPEFKDNKETRDTRSQLQKIKGRLPHGTFSLPAYLKPSGTPGTAPVPDALLQGVFGTKVNRAADTVQANPAPTVNSFAAGTLASFKVGQPILVAIGGHAELRRITSIDAAIHVAPDMSAAPLAGAAIYAAVGYTLADDLPSFTIWRDLGHTVVAYPGAVIDKLTVPFTGSDEVVATFGGGYQREVRCGTDKLAADVAGAGTVNITVLDGTKFDLGARFNLSDGTNTETKCTVTGIAGNVLTVTRGAGAQAWTAANGVDIYPWLPVGTDSGSVIQGRRGSCMLNGISTALLSMTIDIDGKAVFHEDEATDTGQDYAASYATPGVRDVKQKLEVYFRQKHLGIFNAAANITAEEVWKPAYEMDANGYPVPGKIVAFMTPQVQFLMPDIGDKNGERVLAVECHPYGSTTGNDELSLWFC